MARNRFAFRERGALYTGRVEASISPRPTRNVYRVNFEVNNLKPFACLAFPQTTYLKTPRKQPIFGDELVTSFMRLKPMQSPFSAKRFSTHSRTRLPHTLARIDASASERNSLDILMAFGFGTERFCCLWIVKLQPYYGGRHVPAGLYAQVVFNFLKPLTFL